MKMEPPETRGCLECGGVLTINPRFCSEECWKAYWGVGEDKEDDEDAMA